MKEVTDISIAELTEMSASMYGDLVKALVDLERGIFVVDAELHVDQEQYLLEQGSRQEDLWGINLYPGKYGSDKFIEFDSMINIRPRRHNMSRGVEDAVTRIKIVALVERKVHI